MEAAPPFPLFQMADGLHEYPPRPALPAPLPPVLPLEAEVQALRELVTALQYEIAQQHKRMNKLERQLYDVTFAVGGFRYDHADE